MRILLISDNHGYSDAGMLKFASEADEVWHAGDWLNMDLLLKLEEKNIKVRAVWGNADGQELRRIFKEVLSFEIEGLRILMTHIGGYPGRYNKQAEKAIREFKPNVFICGHSHILRVDRDEKYNKMLCLNPGACGLQGFHKVRTALRFEIKSGRIADLAAIEFGTRS